MTKEAVLPGAHPGEQGSGKDTHAEKSRKEEDQVGAGVIPGEKPQAGGQAITHPKGRQEMELTQRHATHT